jgi:hypothetical protein
VLWDIGAQGPTECQREIERVVDGGKCVWLVESWTGR